MSFRTFQGAVETLATIAVVHIESETKPQEAEAAIKSIVELKEAALKVNPEIGSNARAACCQNQLERIERAKRKVEKDGDMRGL